MKKERKEKKKDFILSRRRKKTERAKINNILREVEWVWDEYLKEREMIACVCLLYFTLKKHHKPFQLKV